MKPLALWLAVLVSLAGCASHRQPPGTVHTAVLETRLADAKGHTQDATVSAQKVGNNLGMVRAKSQQIDDKAEIVLRYWRP